MAAAMAEKAPDGIGAAIDGVRTSVHALSLPASAQKQLAEVLPFELEAVLPVDMAESTFDYRVLPAARGDAGAAALITVLAVVARIEDVRARIELLKGALSMEPERVGAGGLPLANLTATNPTLIDEQPVVLVDLGTRTSEVLVLVGGEPVFARTASWGTQGLPGTAPEAGA